MTSDQQIWVSPEEAGTKDKAQRFIFSPAMLAWNIQVNAYVSPWENKYEGSAVGKQDNVPTAIDGVPVQFEVVGEIRKQEP